MPPASLPARGGGALRGPHGGSARGRPGSAAGHNRPAARRGRRRPRRAARRPRPPPPRGAGSHPPGEERARSPSLGVQLQHGFRPPLRPPSRSRPACHCAAAIPEAARAPGRPCALPACAPVGTRGTRQTRGNKVGLAACDPRPVQVVVATHKTEVPNFLGAGTCEVKPRTPTLSPRFRRGSHQKGEEDPRGQ